MFANTIIALTKQKETYNIRYITVKEIKAD